MKKLIKLSDEHYIIVDDSEIKDNDYQLRLDTLKISRFGDIEKDDIKRFKITHSNIGHMFQDSIKPLSLSEVKEAIYGYNWKTEFEKANLKYGSEQHSFYLGFKAHQELVKDKLFTIEDMFKCFQAGIDYEREDGILQPDAYGYIKSLLPKTEWDVEIDEQGKIKLI